MAKKTKLVIVCGLPGTGKSTVARIFAEKLGGELLRTDAIRKEDNPKPVYTRTTNKMVYIEMFRRTANLLESGKKVVLDAVFGGLGMRRRAVELAAEKEIDLKIVQVTADETTIKDRITRRTNDVSDANWQVYLRVKAIYRPLLEPHLDFDNSGSLEQAENKIDKLVSNWE